MVASTILLLLLGMPASAADRTGTHVLPVVDKDDLRFVPLSAGGETLNNWIDGIAQDNQGFLWFATGDGLYRYDGYELTPFRHDPQTPDSLGANSIRAIYKGRDGALWIGTTDSGLDRLDPARGVFTHYRHQPGLDASLTHDRMTSIYQDPSGTLWIGTTEGGLDSFDASTETFVHHRHNPRDPTSLSSDGITTIYQDSLGNLWVGTVAGLNKLDRATGRSTRFFHDPANPRSLAGDYVGSIVEDRLGTLWIGSSVGGGLSALDLKTGHFTRYSFYSEQPGRESNTGVTAMLADADGSLWLTTIDHGLLKLDPARKEFSRYLSGQTTRIFEDAEGSIWIGTRNRGVMRFIRKPAAFVSYWNQGSLKDLPKEDIQSVGTDSLGFVWIATASGLRMLDPRTGRATVYRHDPKNPFSISDAPVFATVEDHSGRMWFGTYGAGLNGFDRGTGRFVSYRHDPKDPRSLSSDRIMCLMVDHDGMLWIAAEGQGLDRFDPNTGKFENYRPDPSGPLGGTANYVTSVFEDRAGTLWVVGPVGLEHLDRQSGRFTTDRYDPSPGTLSIHQDRRGTMWVGRVDGLDRIDPSGTVKKFTTKDGLPNPYIKAILEDPRGDLWLATGNGLSHFSPETGKFRNYFASDGLPDNSFELLGNSGQAMANGELVFGSPNGVAVVDPAQVDPKTHIPPVVLTDFLLFNKPVSVGSDSPLKRPISATDAITLNHSQSIFTLEFAALSYVDPEKNRYRYRMEGLATEKDWEEVDSTRRSQTFVSLPPGHYVFRVQGSNNDQVWNEAGVRLAITVLPPWYSTWWFITASVLLVAGMVILTYKLRMRNLRLTAVRLEGQVAERTLELKAAKESAEIAKDAAESANRAKSTFLSHMSHELRTPLNAILGFARLLREDGLSQKQRADVDTISRSGEHLLGLINDVLDMAKIEAGRTTAEIAPCDLGRLVLDVTSMMRARATEKNLELRTVQAEDLPQFVETDGQKLREMLINLLSNAVKYTERGSVTLRLGWEPGSDPEVLLSFEVQDTGIGIAPEEQERIFEPFVQVGNVLRQKGTGLGLAITRQFAVLMGGTLRVVSAPGQGAIFRLELPAKRAEPFVSDSGFEQREYVLAAGQPEYRVLVVDDEPENRSLLERLVRQAGFQVRVADDGAQAVDAFQDWPPHFIWMDLRMPGLDGSEAAQRIRALEGGRDVKIVAVTASEYTHSAAGMDDIVHKPYGAKDIFDCMARHLGVSYRSPDAAPGPPIETPDTLRPEALAALPRELRAELTDAVLALNINQIDAAIQRISEVDAKLGAALAFHADRFAFTQILEVLERCENATFRS